jgi:hypothetical protein
LPDSSLVGKGKRMYVMFYSVLVFSSNRPPYLTCHSCTHSILVQMNTNTRHRTDWRRIIFGGPLFESRPDVFFLGFLEWCETVHVVLRYLFGLLYQPRMTDDDADECGAVGGMRIGRGNRSMRRKPAPVPLRPQITPDLGSNPCHRCGKPAANPPELWHGLSLSEYRAILRYSVVFVSKCLGSTRGLISLWFYKEYKLRIETMYLLYMFPPKLHTLMTSLF